MESGDLSHRKVSIHGFCNSRQLFLKTDAFIASLCMFHNRIVNFLFFFLNLGPVMLLLGKVSTKSRNRMLLYS